jgi:hypothetical protein
MAVFEINMVLTAELTAKFAAVTFSVTYHLRVSDGT